MSSRRSTAGAFPSSASSARRSSSRRRSSATGTTCSARAVRFRSPRRAPLEGGAARAARQRPLARVVHRRRAGPLDVHGRGVDRPDRVVAGGGDAQARRRADGSRRASCPRGGRCSATTSCRSRRRSRSKSTDRHGLTELDARLGVDVDVELARFGAWYELFPRSWGGFAGVERVLPQLAELGFDVVYLPPIHPIGVHEPQGPQQRRRREARRRRQPVGDRRGGGRPHGDPSRARHARRLRAARRARARGSASRSRSTSRSSARPTTRGSRSIPSGSTAARTGR